MAAPSSPVVLVTGSSKGGIGFALCEAFAEMGCTVYATSRRIESMEGFKHPGVHRMVMDVNSDESVKSVVEIIVEQAGRIDFVVANAGIACHGPILDIPISQAQDLFDTNFLGVLRLAQAVFPHFAERKRGSFITIGSISGKIPTPWAGLYSASKSAVHALTEGLQMEACALSPDIHVTLVAPGGVRSNIVNNYAPMFSLPSTSLYKAYLDKIIFRLNSSQAEGTMENGQFAKQVVAEALRRGGPRRYLTLGKFSGTMKVLEWLPRGFVLWLFWRRLAALK